jgi:hypothetical protein
MELLEEHTDCDNSAVTNARLAIRKAEALKIDPETADVIWDWGYIGDPYGVEQDVPEEYKCIGRLYFARAPGSDVWVSYYDLPAEIVRKMPEEDRYEGMDLIPGIDEPMR